MKRLLSTLFLLLSFIKIIADNTYPVLVVWKSDGTKVVFALSEQPRTTFTSTGVKISTDFFSVTYPVASVLKYTYEERTGEIDGVMPVAGEITVQQVGSDIIFNNLKEETTIQVYSVNGSLVSTQTNKGKQTTISLGNHANGVYIIKVGETSYKVIKR